MFENSLLYIYFVFNIALFIYAMYIFWRVSPDMVKKSEHFAFRMFIVSFIAYLLFNNLWTLQEYDLIQLPRIIFIIISFFSYLSVAYTTFCFYSYTMIHFNLSFNKNVKSIVISFIPFCCSFILLVISLINEFIVKLPEEIVIFKVTEDNNIVTGPLFIILLVISFVYLLLIAGVSIYKAIKTKSKYARNDALGLTACVVFLIIWALMDDKFDRITIIPIAVFSVIFFLYASMTRANINTDALTKIGNRRRADEFISSRLEDVSPSSPSYLFMSDINEFKRINDRYGHIEGDDVLIIISSSINSVMGRHSGFVARYGGDEFIWLWEPEKSSNLTPESIIEEVNVEIQNKFQSIGKVYRAEISTGYVLCNDPKRTINSYIKEADEMMYRIKDEYYKNKSQNKQLYA